MAGKDISDMSFDEFFGRGGSKRKERTEPVKETKDVVPAEPKGPVADSSGFQRGRPKLNVRSGQVLLYIPKYVGGKGAKYKVTVEQGGMTIELGRLKVSPLDSDSCSLPTEFDMIASGLSPLGAFNLSIDGKLVYDMFEHSHMMFSADGMPISRAEDTTLVLYPADRYLWLTDAKVAASVDIADMRLDTVDVAQGGYVRVRDRPQVIREKKVEEVPKETKTKKAKASAAISLAVADHIVGVKDGKGVLPLYASAPGLSFTFKNADPASAEVRIVTASAEVLVPYGEYDGSQLSEVSGKVTVSALLEGKALASESFFIIPGFATTYNSKGDIPESDEVTFTIGGVEHTVDIHKDGTDGPFPFDGGEVRLSCTIPIVSYDIGAGPVPFADEEVSVDDLPDSIVITVKGAVKKALFLGSTGKKVNLTPDWEDDTIRLDASVVRSAVFDSPTRSAMLYITVNSCPVRRFLTVVNRVAMSVRLEGDEIVADVGSSGDHVCRVFNLDKTVDTIELQPGVNRVPVGPGAVSAEVAEVREGKTIAVENVVIREIPFLMRDVMGDVWFHVSKDKRIPLPDGLLGSNDAEVRKWHSQIVRMNPELRNVSPEKTVKAFKDFGSN